MRIANTFTFIGAVLCAAGCASEAANSGQAEHSHNETQAGSTAAGGQAGNKAATGVAVQAASAAGAGTRAPVSPSLAAGAGGAVSIPTDVASAGALGAAPAAAGGGGTAAAAGGAAAPAATEKFSFFVTSLQGMRDLSKNENGFGGDLRYGESTGLKGADKICTELAELSMPGAGAKGWHAFLSAAKGSESAGPVHAKDRIGTGPWYDRLGRLVAMNLQSLLSERPAGSDPAITDDLPNERGEPNHTDTMEGMDDNHDVVTATNAQGMYDGRTTCEDWTSTMTPMPMQPAQPMMMGPFGMMGGFADDGPGLGHSWPSEFSGSSWIATHPAPGCGASVALVQTGPGEGTGIGNAGGYGGIYCFALKP
jgi:hypothetical protein